MLATNSDLDLEAGENVLANRVPIYRVQQAAAHSNVPRELWRRRELGVELDKEVSPVILAAQNNSGAVPAPLVPELRKHVQLQRSLRSDVDFTCQKSREQGVGLGKRPEDGPIHLRPPKEILVETLKDLGLPGSIVSEAGNRLVRADRDLSFASKIAEEE